MLDGVASRAFIRGPDGSWNPWLGIIPATILPPRLLFFLKTPNTPFHRIDRIKGRPTQSYHILIIHFHHQLTRSCFFAI